jgi:hypothetical protein
VERTAKLIVLTSMAIAVAIASLIAREAWPAVWPLTIGVFALAAALALVNEDVAVATVLVFTFTFPAVFLLSRGRFAWETDVVWMAAVLGAIFPRAARTGWAVPFRWRTPLVLWALTLALTWPIVALREIDFHFDVLDALHMASSAAGGVPQAAVTFIVQATMTLGIGILWFDWLCATSGANFNRFRHAVMPALAASWFVTAAVAAYQVFVDVTFLNGGLFGYEGRASGTMYDANPFGVVAAVMGVATVAWATGFERLRKWWIAGPLLLLSWIGLWGSGSRTALMTGIITLVFLIWHALYEGRTDGRTRRVLPLATVAAVVILLAVVSSIGSSAVGPLRRLYDSLPGFSTRSVSAFFTEMWNRNGYGAASVLIIEQHPIVGTGPGSFFFLVPDYSIMTGSAPLPPDNAQNWYRHQLAEFGVLGSLGWIAWVAIFGWFVVKARPARAADRPTAGVLRGILVALGIISIVGMPAWNPAVTLTFWTMAFWLTAVVSPETVGPQNRDGAISATRWIVMGLVLLAFLGGTAYAARRDLRVPNRAAAHGWRYSYGFYEPEHAADGSMYQWAGQHAVTVLTATKPWLRLTVRVNHADIARKPVDVKVWTGSERVVATTLRSIDPVIEFVRLPDGASRVVLETWASRVVRPRDFGLDDPRALGLMVAWDFVDAPARVAAP